mmetsp:Transcript_17666/g.29764  ORF Transcript_17666/g.29764 Transcript_17666/m.29764 type:complete len:205 (-) Transcript_17666:342-956(-)
MSLPRVATVALQMAGESGSMHSDSSRYCRYGSPASCTIVWALARLSRTVSSRWVVALRGAAALLVAVRKAKGTVETAGLAGAPVNVERTCWRSSSPESTRVFTAVSGSVVGRGVACVALELEETPPLLLVVTVTPVVVAPVPPWRVAKELPMPEVPAAECWCPRMRRRWYWSCRKSLLTKGGSESQATSCKDSLTASSAALAKG